MLDARLKWRAARMVPADIAALGTLTEGYAQNLITGLRARRCPTGRSTPNVLFVGGDDLEAQPESLNEG
jgi:hypothetical protein